MVFTPFKAKYGKNDVVALREDMISYKTNEGGIFSKDHRFRVTSLYVQNTFSNVRYYGTLQPASQADKNTVPYVYCLEDLNNNKLTCQCEERDIRLIKRGDPQEVVERPIYTRIGKDKTTEHTKPRTDVQDKSLKKALKEIKEQETKPKTKLLLNIGKKK